MTAVLIVKLMSNFTETGTSLQDTEWSNIYIYYKSSERLIVIIYLHVNTK